MNEVFVIMSGDDYAPVIEGVLTDRGAAIEQVASMNATGVGNYGLWINEFVEGEFRDSNNHEISSMGYDAGDVTTLEYSTWDEYYRVKAKRDEWYKKQYERAVETQIEHVYYAPGQVLCPKNTKVQDEQPEEVRFTQAGYLYCGYCSGFIPSTIFDIENNDEPAHDAQNMEQIRANILKVVTAELEKREAAGEDVWETAIE